MQLIPLVTMFRSLMIHFKPAIKKHLAATHPKQGINPVRRPRTPRSTPRKLTSLFHTGGSQILVSEGQFSHEAALCFRADQPGQTFASASQPAEHYILPDE